MASDELIVNYEDGLQIITFNRPKKLNSINGDIYTSLITVLQEAAHRDDVNITVMTGNGTYFSAGNDFGAESLKSGTEIEGSLRTSIAVLSKYINLLIEYPKLLIAIVNGPAIGIAVTMLSHFDVVYASENATFQTPFSLLGLCAEGCSSYMFPRVLGKSLTSKMLYFNHKMSAQEAKNCGFVAQVYQEGAFPSVLEELKTYAKFPVNSLMASKRLIKANDIQFLKSVNSFELETLIERFMSEDFFNAMMAMMAKRKKNKL